MERGDTTVQANEAGRIMHSPLLVPAGVTKAFHNSLSWSPDEATKVKVIREEMVAFEEKRSQTLMRIAATMLMIDAVVRHPP